MDLSGRHVVITGASRGVGAAIARTIATAGAHVTGVARTRDQLEPAMADVGGRAVVADVARVDDVLRGLHAATSDLGPVDVLVNNAAIIRPGRLQHLDPAAVEEMVGVDLLAPLRLTRHVLPQMVERGVGHVVSVVGVAAFGPVPGLATYAASCAGLVALHRSLALDLRGTGVGHTLAVLGPVATQLQDDLQGNEAYRATTRRLATLRLSRTLTADEVARAVTAAIEQGRDRVVLPRRLGPVVATAELPGAVVRRVLGRIADLA